MDPRYLLRRVERRSWGVKGHCQDGPGPLGDMMDLYRSDLIGQHWDLDVLLELLQLLKWLVPTFMGRST